MSESSHASRKSSTLRREHELPRQGSSRSQAADNPASALDIVALAGIAGDHPQHPHGSAITPISRSGLLSDENSGYGDSRLPGVLSHPLSSNKAVATAQEGRLGMATATTAAETRESSHLRQSQTPHNQQSSFDLYLHNHRKGETPNRDQPPSASPDEQPRNLGRPAYSDTLPDHILALPPLSSPTSTPKSPPTPPARPVLGRPIQFVEDNEERWKYRSWRQGHPVLGGRVMAAGRGEEPGSSVDKKIEATLPRAEQATVARSRKTSHLLGIFKQNEQSAEQREEDTFQHDIIPEYEERSDSSADERPEPRGKFMFPYVHRFTLWLSLHDT